MRANTTEREGTSSAFLMTSKYRSGHVAYKDPAKRRAARQRYLERKKVAKYGPDAAGQDMRGRHGNHATGEKNGRWNGGRWMHPDGYVGIAVPEGHHLRQAHGYAFEHQIVAEIMLGRRLRQDEVVHHRNGDRTDNRPENLEVTTRGEHARHHTSLPGTRDNLGRFTNAPRHCPDEPPADLRVRELPR